LRPIAAAPPSSQGPAAREAGRELLFYQSVAPKAGIRHRTRQNRCWAHEPLRGLLRL